MNGPSWLELNNFIKEAWSGIKNIEKLLEANDYDEARKAYKKLLDQIERFLMVARLFIEERSLERFKNNLDSDEYLIGQKLTILISGTKDALDVISNSKEPDDDFLEWYKTMNNTVDEIGLLAQKEIQSN